MEDFTSKKTQIASGAPVIKKVFRMREGGVVIDNFTQKVGSGTETATEIYPGTLIGLKSDNSISAYPINTGGIYDLSNKDYIPLGFTTDFVTTEKPQAALMTWGIINPKAYKEAFGKDFPMPFALAINEGTAEVAMFNSTLMSYGIVVTLESDGIIKFPQQSASGGSGIN